MVNSRFNTDTEFATFKDHVRNQFQPLGTLDKRLSENLSFLIKNSKDFEEGTPTSERFLFVVGPSGSGKSFTLRHHFKRTAAFQPFINAQGKEVKPFLSFEAPNKFASRDILATILEKMGLPNQGSENTLRGVLRTQIPKSGLKFLHIDEAQHAIRSNTPKTLQAFQDAIKSLVKLDDWPLHVILSGIPTLSALRTTDDQILRRSNSLAIRPVTVPADAQYVLTAIKTVAVTHCGLTLDPNLETEEFAGRLCASCGGAWGYMIEVVQNACFLAIENNREMLKVSHFAHNYRMKHGCRENENIFTAPGEFWRKLVPANAHADMGA
jgi:hypothetical protein